MSQRKLSLFIPITKVDEENRLVYGTLAAEEIDNSGEIFDYESSKPNFEKWSDEQYEASGGLSKGNVRAMHTSIAAGKLTDISYDDDNKMIEGVAKVVDDGEWNKVLEGVYTGFSMGGRYEKRWNDNGNTRYTAKPVEMSLVDKPCIKSAKFAGLSKTFMLQKADGTTEERQFHVDDDTIFKGDTMYVPTNDEILPVAQALAKAAGKTDADWLDFSDAAREQIIAEHSGDGGTVAKADAAEHTDEDCKVENCDKCADMAAKADAGEPATAAAEGEGGEQGVAKAAGPDEGDHSGEGDQEPAAQTTEEPGAAEKADKVTPPGVRQMWTASDGQTFEKKADAEAHEATLAKGDAPASLSESLDSALATVQTLAKGETVEAPAGIDEEQPLGKSIDTQLLELADFLTGPDLRKGLYDVSSLTSVLRGAASAYACARNEAAREGDGSTVPAQLLEATEKLGQALIDMASEEVGEMLTDLRSAGESPETYIYPECCYLAASTMGLEKADADEWFGKAIGAFEKRGPRLSKSASTEVEPVDEGELSKAVKAAGFDTTDAFVAGIADLQKKAGELDEIKPKVEELTKFITELKALPRPAAPTTAHAVEKSIDANRAGGNGAQPVTDLQKAEAALAGLSNEDIAKLAIKLSHASGGRQLSLSQ